MGGRHMGGARAAPDRNDVERLQSCARDAQDELGRGGSHTDWGPGIDPQALPSMKSTALPPSVERISSLAFESTCRTDGRNCRPRSLSAVILNLRLGALCP